MVTLPPPREPVVVEASDEPTFTPFTVAPAILNRPEIGRLLIAEYPPLEDAGVDGQVVVWFPIDEEGLVGEARVARTSGHASLALSALRVAERFRFSPALERDRRIAVWVQFPINFTVR